MKSLPRWVKVLLGVLAVLVVAFVLLAAALVISLSGGIDDVFSGPGPTEDSPEVVTARNRAQALIEEELDRFVAGPVTGALGSRPGRIADGHGNDCDVGQHNWKVDTPFDLRCTFVRSVVVAGDLGAFHDDMLELHDRVLVDGWDLDHTAYGGLREVVTDYFDERHGDVFERPSGEVDRYTVSDLPGAIYGRTGDNDRSVEFGWTDPVDPKDQPTMSGLPHHVTLEIDGQPARGLEIGHSLRPDEYGLIVSISYTYFRE